MLWGRRGQCAQIDSLLANAGLGGGHVLVIEGDAGAGKSALADYSARSASGFRVVCATAALDEKDLPFAGLHQICRHLNWDVVMLPGPHRATLGVAFGLEAGPPTDRLRVGQALVSLLSAAAGRQPLLCIVDDAQWLDVESYQALTFAARRLVDERVVLIVSTRDSNSSADFVSAQEIALTPLPAADSLALLRSAIPGRVDPRVLIRVAAEARGNPGRMTTFVRHTSSVELAGGFRVVRSGAALSWAGRALVQKVASLPEACQQLLLTAAADPIGDTALMWRVARQLGLPDEAVAAVEAAGLLEAGTLLLFPDPLDRVAIYAAAPAGERRAVHTALSASIDRQSDPARKAWHSAQGTSAPDERVATELEDATAQAQDHGGVAAAAAFMERAAELTVDPARRIRRAVRAGTYAASAGDISTAIRLLTIVEAGPLDAALATRVDTLRARVEYLSSGGETSLSTPSETSFPPFYVDESTSSADELPWMALTAPTARLRWDVQAWRSHCDRLVAMSRNSGALGVQPIALHHRALLNLFAGNLNEASEDIEELHAVARAAGTVPPPSHVALTAFQGIDIVMAPSGVGRAEDSSQPDDIDRTGFHRWAAAVHHNGQGQYTRALVAAQEAAQRLIDPVYTSWADLELVESAARSDSAGLASAVSERLSANACEINTDWSIGVAKYAQALTSHAAGAKCLYEEAVDHLGRTGLKMPLGRAHLLYGEWLHRENHRREARTHLSAAQSIFAGAGATGFAERASRALRAAGGRRTPVNTGLTEREAQVARLAASGLPNPEIAAQLFMSRRTVEHHLTNAFFKLGIKSRTQLEKALAEL